MVILLLRHSNKDDDIDLNLEKQKKWQYVEILKWMDAKIKVYAEMSNAMSTW